MSNSELSSIKTNSGRTKNQKAVDTLKPSDWSLQIALIVAVTLLVTACIISVITNSNKRQYSPVTPYEFPSQKIQRGFSPYW
jgi:hypothetical protein